MNLAELKEKHSVIFCTDIGGRQIFFRPLTWKEFNAYIRTIDAGVECEGHLEDEIFRKIVLDEILIDEMYQTPAGLVPTLVKVAFIVSGNLLETSDDINRMNQDIHLMRERVQNNVYDQFIMIICRAFPTYTPDMVEGLSFHEILRLAVMAEQMLGLDEPLFIQPRKKEKTLTDQLFEDRKRAEMTEHGRPSPVDIRDYLQAQEKPNLSLEMARQIETIKRIKQRRSGL